VSCNGNEILARNVSAISSNGNRKLAVDIQDYKISSRYKVQDCRSGEFTLTVDNKRVHSKYDPKKEAQTQLKNIEKDNGFNGSILLIGLGLGYLAEAVLEKYPDISLLIIEPDIGVFSTACTHRDLTGIVTNANISVGENITPEIKEWLNENDDYSIVVFPSLRLYAENVEFTIKRLLPKRSSNRNISGLRILVVSPLYGGSLPITGYVTEAFEELGHKPYMIDNSVFEQGRKHLSSISKNQSQNDVLGTEYSKVIAKSVVSKAIDIKAQVVFFMAQSPGTYETLMELRKLGIPTAFWFVEDGELFDYALKIAPYYDVFFHIQKGEFEKRLKAAGAKHVHYLPMAANPEIHKPVALSLEEKDIYGSDISHMGAGYHNRRTFLKSLLDYDFKIWGNDWDDAALISKVIQNDGERVSTNEIVKIFNSTKININLHSSTYTDGVNPHGDFVNPRTFEVAACSAFQIVDERSLLNDLFVPGKEIVTFKDLTSCRQVIDYYLEHPEEADKIAKNGRERVLKEHTYKHRMQEAIEIISGNCNIKVSKDQTNSVKSLVTAAGEDEELAKLFRSMGNEEDELSLEGIAESITNSEGELSEMEAIFLMMHEFNKFAKNKGVI
jgi:spore maturation protein CgeB